MNRIQDQEIHLLDDGYQTSFSQYPNLFSEERLFIKTIIIKFIKVHEGMSVNTTY